jgi:predicted transcriptional regulator
MRIQNQAADERPALDEPGGRPGVASVAWCAPARPGAAPVEPQSGPKNLIDTPSGPAIFVVIRLAESLVWEVPMPRDIPDPLTTAEWKVMKIVWRLKSCAARDVYQEAGRAHGWAPTTVKTLLRRLVDKGHLTARPVGTSYLYRPARPAWKSLFGAADSLLDNAMEGMDGRLLAYMVKKSKLTPEDLGELRSLLDRHPQAGLEAGPAGDEP